MNDLLLLHGSNKIVETPTADAGKLQNDYGRGFYCTLDNELACEWATYRDGGSFVNSYVFNTDGLQILHLEDEHFSVLHWITILLEHRLFDIHTPIMESGRDYLTANYHLDLSVYDVITGYRADDSYFSFARDFIGNSLPIEALEEAIRLGNLGLQYFIKSPKAFSRLKFIEAIEVDRSLYSGRRIARDKQARDEYIAIQKSYAFKGTFLRELILGGNP